MNPEQRTNWIDSAGLGALLIRWRYEPLDSPWFLGEVGEHFCGVMEARHAAAPPGEWTAINQMLTKAIG